LGSEQDHPILAERFIDGADGFFARDEPGKEGVVGRINIFSEVGIGWGSMGV